MATLPARIRAALGALFDATNHVEIQRRPREVITTRPIVEEVNTSDRRQLVSDSAKLYANLGPIKGATDAKSMYAVGRSWLPRFVGADKAWGEQAREWLLNEWYPIADISGHDFQTSLFLMSVAVDRDGDVGGMLTEYETGFPAMQLVPGIAIGDRNGEIDRAGKLERGPYRGLRAYDGVVYNDAGRAVAYHVLGASNTGSEDGWVSARDMALLYEPQWVNQVRGFPGFSHALLDLKDLRTVQGYEKMACALASAIGLIEYNETGLAEADDPRNVLRNPTGNQDVVGKEMFGGMIRHFKAGSGQKLESFKNDRPGDAWERFMNRLLRNALAGINWPYELAWDISALGGANSRIILASAMRAVEDRQDLLRPFAKRAVGYAVAKAIKMGKLPPNADWWKWNFTMPARMSADFGRDTAATLEAYKQGTISLTSICEESGMDFGEFVSLLRRERDALAAAGVVSPETIERIGVAVRAAAITPSVEVEEFTRKSLGLPKMGDAVARNWAEVGIARPITVAEDAPPAPPSNGESDGSGEDDAEDSAEMRARLAALAQPIHLNVTLPPPQSPGSTFESLSIVRDAEGRAVGLTKKLT